MQEVKGLQCSLPIDSGKILTINHDAQRVQQLFGSLAIGIYKNAKHTEKARLRVFGQTAYPGIPVPHFFEHR